MNSLWLENNLQTQALVGSMGCVLLYWTLIPQSFLRHKLVSTLRSRGLIIPKLSLEGFLFMKTPRYLHLLNTGKNFEDHCPGSGSNSGIYSFLQFFCQQDCGWYLHHSITTKIKWEPAYNELLYSIWILKKRELSTTETMLTKLKGHDLEQRSKLFNLINNRSLRFLLFPSHFRRVCYLKK